eukprot:761365-Hanusia_phi.AAC.2
MAWAKPRGSVPYRTVPGMIRLGKVRPRAPRLAGIIRRGLTGDHHGMVAAPNPRSVTLPESRGPSESNVRPCLHVCPPE